MSGAGEGDTMSGAGWEIIDSTPHALTDPVPE